MADSNVVETIKCEDCGRLCQREVASFITVIVRSPFIVGPFDLGWWICDRCMQGLLRQWFQGERSS